MTKREMQIEVEKRIQLNDPKMIAETKLNSNMIFSLINEAIDLFWKTRYSGLNTKQQGFEQTQKRTDDLRQLVKSKTFDEIQSQNNIYTVTLPEDYSILLGDTVGILPIGKNDCWQKDQNGKYIEKHSDSIEASIETLDRQLSNSFSEHKLKYCFARPLRIQYDNHIDLYTDGTYKVSTYKLMYLSRPLGIKTSDDLTQIYDEFPEHTHMEIVKLAVRLYSANKPTQNYQALVQETQVME